MNVQVRKAAPLILIAILAVLLFFIRQCKYQQAAKPKVTETTKAPKTNDNDIIDRDKGFDRRTSYLDYSKHAKCRMQCRKISGYEVEQIMKDGKINYNKSDIQSRSPAGTRCPRYAVEGVTTDDQKIRIVFAQCNDKTIVVTVIDLDIEWTCHCP